MKAAMKALPLLALLALAACQTATEVRQGQSISMGGLSVTPRSGWTQFTNTAYRAPVWTADGLDLNLIQFRTGINKGEAVYWLARRSETKFATWDPEMTDFDLADAVAEGYAGIGAVGFESSGLDPTEIDGREALKFSFTYTDPNDLIYDGLAFAIRDRGRLHLILFQAPREHYFAASEAAVRAIFDSVRLTGASS